MLTPDPAEIEKMLYPKGWHLRPRPAVVKAGVFPGQVRLIIDPNSQGTGWVRDVPETLVPFDLRTPGTHVLLEFDEDKKIIAVRKKPEPAPIPLTDSEKAAILEAIEKLEAAASSQPADCEPLERLKQLYAKLDRQADVINTTKRLGKILFQKGQLSAAVMEYETVLQYDFNDAETKRALLEIEKVVEARFK